MSDEEQRATLLAIMSNARVSERYLALARDLDVMAPRTPEEVCLQCLDFCLFAPETSTRETQTSWRPAHHRRYVVENSGALVPSPAPEAWSWDA